MSESHYSRTRRSSNKVVFEALIDALVVLKDDVERLEGERDDADAGRSNLRAGIDTIKAERDALQEQLDTAKGLLTKWIAWYDGKDEPPGSPHEDTRAFLEVSNE